MSFTVATETQAERAEGIGRYYRYETGRAKRLQHLPSDQLDRIVLIKSVSRFKHGTSVTWCLNAVGKTGYVVNLPTADEREPLQELGEKIANFSGSASPLKISAPAARRALRPSPAEA